MADAHLLQVSVVSADQEVWSGEAEMVTAMTLEGSLGVLAGHQPVLAVLAEGEVGITLPGGERIAADASEGFLSVDHDVVTVVASKAALV